MTNSQIKGTGDSRYLKSVSNFLTQYPTYADFATALVAGTLPIDLNGINASGFDVIGTPLNKATLLSDTTATALGLTGDPTVDDALSQIASAKANLASPTFSGTPKAPTAADSTNNTQIATTAFVKTAINNSLNGVSKIEHGCYVGTGAYGSGSPCSITFANVPAAVIFVTPTLSTIYAWGNIKWSNRTVAINDKTMSWYASSAANQLNTNGELVEYIAIYTSGLTVYTWDIYDAIVSTVYRGYYKYCNVSGSNFEMSNLTTLSQLFGTNSFYVGNTISNDSIADGVAVTAATLDDLYDAAYNYTYIQTAADYEGDTKEYIFGFSGTPTTLGTYKKYVLIGKAGQIVSVPVLDSATQTQGPRTVTSSATTGWYNDGYYYTSVTPETTYTKGSATGNYVKSINSTAYPNDNHQGGYWYTKR